MLVELQNLGPDPAQVLVPERLGEELTFVAEGREGPVPRASWSSETTGSPLHATPLAPGGSLALPCDLSRWLAFPGPGTYQVRAERIDLGSRRAGVTRSAWVEVRIP
jgi:hypothetical protein